MRKISLKKAQEILTSRGFRHSHDGVDRQYWVRTDGKPEVFLDHSATISLYPGHHISDFVNKTERVPEPARILEVCKRCGIGIRPEGGHLCGDCGRDI